MSENFYHTVLGYPLSFKNIFSSIGYIESARCLSNTFCHLLMQGMRPSGVIRGCVAMKTEGRSFIISKRLKWDIDQFVFVNNVDHVKMQVSVFGDNKASLNAPLIDWIFKQIKWSYAVIHWHGNRGSEVKWNFKVLPYYEPGSIQDSQRELKFAKSGDVRDFYIEDHGFFKILSKEECESILK